MLSFRTVLCWRRLVNSIILGFKLHFFIAFILAVVIIVQIGGAFGLRLVLAELEVVERTTTGKQEQNKDNEQRAAAAFLLLPSVPIYRAYMES